MFEGLAKLPAAGCRACAPGAARPREHRAGRDRTRR